MVKPRPRTPHLDGAQRWVSWCAAVVLGLGVASMASDAHAAEPPSASDNHDDEQDDEPVLGRTAFGMPRLSWSMAPPMHLQPERARLILTLPSEWMPTPDPGQVRIHIPTTKDFEFQRERLNATARVGSEIRLHLTVPRHALDFDLSLMPRAAIAVLRFDPVHWTK